MSESHHNLEKIITYMKSHWPSQVKPEWQVPLDAYPQILQQVVIDFTKDASRGHTLFRLAGLSGSGKTTQLLPAAEAHFAQNNLQPILVAARRFVDYHPYKHEIESHYGSENLRKLTDEFSTIMLFLTLSELIKNGYDIILDVTFLDPEMEAILLDMITAAKYQMTILMIAVSPIVTEHFLSRRAWRHSKETEAEFVRATEKALEFYAANSPKTRLILWNVYDTDPVHDGPIETALSIFRTCSARTDLSALSQTTSKSAKIAYLKSH